MVVLETVVTFYFIQKRCRVHYARAKFCQTDKKKKPRGIRMNPQGFEVDAIFL
jgi:hypothetical protein